MYIHPADKKTLIILMVKNTTSKTLKNHHVFEYAQQLILACHLAHQKQLIQFGLQVSNLFALYLILQPIFLKFLLHLCLELSCA